MITRIVRLSIRPEQENLFLEHFNAVCKDIRNFPGCQHLELMRDADEACIFYTLSKWNSVAQLEDYRKSPLFKSTWDKVKPMFSEAARAFSMTNIVHSQGF